jgi:hypothetical protein
MTNKFEGLSHQSLSDAKLNRLDLVSRLQRDSRWARERLTGIRSDLYAARRELVQIECLLRVVEFPKRPELPSLTSRIVINQR